MLIRRHSSTRKKIRDYQHFVAKLGKFNPYVFCLGEPIEIKSISENELLRAYEIIKSEEIDKRVVMNDIEFTDMITEGLFSLGPFAIFQDSQFTIEYEIMEIQSFKEARVHTNDEGIVCTTNDGSVFHVTVQKVG